MQVPLHLSALMSDVSKSVTELQQQTGFLVSLPRLLLVFKPSYDLERRHLLRDACLRIAC